jgi:hypothetical protein
MSTPSHPSNSIEKVKLHAIIPQRRVIKEDFSGDIFIKYITPTHN